MALITRRRALRTGLVTGGGLALSSGTLAACSRVLDGDKLTDSPRAHEVLTLGERWNLLSQRFLLQGGQLAREYKASEISPVTRGDGTLHPGGDDYAAALETGFRDWRLRIDGLVTRPLSLSLDDLRRMPAQTQITRHDCVEGWSYIAQWTGVPLGLLLHLAGALPQARYGVFYCADNLDGEPAKGGEQAPGQYYESLGPADLYHPQSLVAYGLNGHPLPIQNGAPLRLRVARQLGYKQAKYLQRIQLVNSLHGINGGKGGYWEDRGYDWYAGM